MDDRLKQRLIGAIVLVALAVIFIPMILDGGADKGLPPFGEAIPDKPAALKRLEKSKPAALEVPEPPAMVERRLIDKNSAAPKAQTTTTTQSTADKKPTLAKNSNSKKSVDSKGVKAWVVQAGSFEHQKNALALRDKLRKYRYRAFVESVKSNGTINYRVRIGPEVRRSSAENIQKELLAKLKINGVVMGHP